MSFVADEPVSLSAGLDAEPQGAYALSLLLTKDGAELLELEKAHIVGAPEERYTLAPREERFTAVEKVIKTFTTTGRTTPLSPAVDRQRARYGLPPLPPVPVEEIQKLIEPAPGQGDQP